MKKIECLILDWAGTAVDYGCFAPVAAFSESFRSLGLNVGTEEIRAHMGLTKIEEIRALFRSGHTAEEFRRLHGRPYEESDVQACYAKFQEVLLDSLGHYSAPCCPRSCARPSSPPSSTLAPTSTSPASTAASRNADLSSTREKYPRPTPSASAPSATSIPPTSSGSPPSSPNSALEPVGLCPAAGGGP